MIEQQNSDTDSELEVSDSDVAADLSLSRKDVFIGQGAIKKKKAAEKTKGKTRQTQKQSVELKCKFEDIDPALKWQRTPCAKKSRTKQKNIVKVRSGPTRRAKNITDESSAFFKMIDDDMLEEILECTNLRIQSEKANYSRDRDCRDMSKSELLALIGLLFLIGSRHSHHANVRELWESDGTGMMFLRATMSYTRLLFLLRYLRFDDSSTRAARKQTDKLAPIRSILDQFVENCKKHYTMGQYMTIDEMLHPFRGRCEFIQYNPKKPAKYGLKFFAKCDAETFYTHNLEVYCGKQPKGPYDVSNCPHDVVMRLVKPSTGENRNLTTDNWYTSHELGQDLLMEKITLLGTMRKNKREIPIEFLPSKNSVPETSLFGFQPETTLVSYVPKPNKAVVLLSTMHDSDDIDPETKKPLMVLDYNDTKGSVDVVDKMCATSSVSRITRRWPLALFFVFLNIAGINAQILYFAVKSESFRRRIFLKNLAFGLMKPLLMERATLSIYLPKDIKLFLQKFRPVTDNDKDNNKVPSKTAKKGRCFLCPNSNTTVKCNNCLRFVCKKHCNSVVNCAKCESHTHSDGVLSD